MLLLSSEGRFSFYYAAVFGSIGATAPFAAVWMSHAGISPSQIGLIIAAPSVLMLLTTVRLGRWADALADRRNAIIAGNWIIMLAHIPLFVSVEPWLLLCSWVLAGLAMYAMIPVTDASALSLTMRQCSDFARIRLWGSVGYIVTVTLAGYTYERAGISAFLLILMLGNVMRLLLAGMLPGKVQHASSSGTDRPVHLSVESNLTTGNGLRQRHPLQQYGILLTLASASLINASHAMFNTFGILHWTTQGMSESTASLAVSTGVVAEVLLMWQFRSISRHVSARAVLLISAVSGLVRWSVLASSPSLAVLFPVQLLHGITFGMTYLATASFIARRIPDADAARGQTLFATLSTGTLAVATFITGLLYDQWGGHLYWLMCVCCLCGAATLAISYRFSIDNLPSSRH